MVSGPEGMRRPRSRLPRASGRKTLDRTIGKGRPATARAMLQHHREEPDVNPTKSLTTPSEGDASHPGPIMSGDTPPTGRQTDANRQLAASLAATSARTPTKTNCASRPAQGHDHIMGGLRGKPRPRCSGDEQERATNRSNSFKAWKLGHGTLSGTDYGGPPQRLLSHTPQTKHRLSLGKRDRPYRAGLKIRGRS